MKILAVDTALGACSVAVIEGERVLAYRHAFMDRGHAEALTPMVEDAMHEAKVEFPALDRLAVTTGPGTFTGQRIGLAFMRALRIALHRPLIGITTLAAMEEAAKAEVVLSRAIALHDARRDEVYVEIDNGPQVLPFDDAVRMLRNIEGESPIALAGTAAPRACDALSKRFVLSTIRQPDALWVAWLADAAVETNAAPQPLYLRAPDAKLPAVRA